ncbi:hypothetical protein [Flavitalea sp.]|nr:hypothetical protein [Flavitalea sp.]
MKHKLKIKNTSLLLSALLMLTVWTSCKKDQPIDEDGLLITTRSECYVSNFELLGADFVTVRTKTAAIDTLAQTIRVEVQYGTDLKNLYPQFTLITDAKLDPKIPGKVDFSDLANPKIWTVISGNRQVKKPYTVYITVQPK